MSNTATTITVEEITASAISLLKREQIKRLLHRLDDVSITAQVLDLMEMPQLMELSANVAVENIKAGGIKLLIGTDKIAEGILDYKLEGDLDYLKILADEMAGKGTYEFEKEPLFHQVSAVITAAQMVANEIDEVESKPILNKGAALQDLQAGTQERAEKTKEFLDDLFAFLAKRLKKPAA